jgi:hypothetical protein
MEDTGSTRHRRDILSSRVIHLRGESFETVKEMVQRELIEFWGIGVILSSMDSRDSASRDMDSQDTEVSRR